MKALVWGVLLLMMAGSVSATLVVGGSSDARETVHAVIKAEHLERVVYRVDLAPYQSRYFDGYAWYKARRIMLYEQAWEGGQFLDVLRHELGHLVCEDRGLNRFNYRHNEDCAEQQAARLT